MKRHLLYLMVGTATLLGCQEADYYPEGLRPYQVEYILTDGDYKDWFLQEWRINGESQPVSTCADSVRWSFEMITEDSISAYALTFDENCLMYDTAVFGRLKASGSDYFEDSLVYELPNGQSRFMMVQNITSNFLQVNYTQSGNQYYASLVAIETGILARQVKAMLYGSPDSTKRWALTKLILNDKAVNLSQCADTTFFEFHKSTTALTLDFIDPIDSCRALDVDFFGYVSVPASNPGGYFTGKVLLEGGAVDQLDFVSFDQTTFTVDYEHADGSFRATYKEAAE